ncbi:MAG: efflux RND transporter periplasmic adaptor subunit [Bacteroidales bacterium]
MKKSILYIVLPILLGGAVASYVFINSSESGAVVETPVTSTTAMPSQPMSMATNTAMGGESNKMGNTPQKLILPGEIVADRRSEIFAKTLSYVKSVRVDIGSKVNRGDILMELDAPELTAQVASLHSKVISLESQFKLASSNYSRALNASKIEGSVSQITLDELLSKMESTQAMLAATESDLQQAKAMTDYLTIRAPFAGVVTRRTVDIGSMVGPSSNSSKEPMMMLQDNEKLRLQIAINEKYAPLVSVGDTISFTVRSLGDRLFKAEVSRKAGALDSRLRAELIEADFKNMDGKLLPGMVADVTVSL